MSFRFCDSFDHYATANLAAKWTSVSGVSLSTAGRNGTCVSGNGSINKTLDMQATWYIGFAAKGIGGLSATNPYSLTALNTSGGLNNVAAIRWNTDSSLSIVTGGSIPVATTVPFDWTGSFHYVEMSIVLTGTATVTASCVLRVNSETVANGSGSCGFASSAIIGGAAKANVHTFSPAVSGFIDDVYINDAQGSFNTTFMGDVKVGVVYPNGDNTVQWTGTGSSTATNYVNVNEHSPDGDTSYVYSTATGSMDLYDWEDISAFTGTVKGVQFLVYARKDDEGARVINLLEGTTGTNTLTNSAGLVDVYLNDNYDYHHIALDTSPSTGTNWTVAGFNADRFGYRIGTNT